MLDIEGFKKEVVDTKIECEKLINEACEKAL